MVLPKKYWRKMMKKKKEKEIMISSKKRTMDILRFPHDLIIEIFLRSPAQSLLRFRWACKSCFNLIRDASFVNMNNNIINHKPNNNPLVMIYHYNGKLKLKSYNICMDIDLTLPLCPNSLVSVRGPPLKSFNDSYEILGFCNGLLCMGVSTCVLVCERYIIWNPCTKEYKKASKRIFTGNDCCNGNNFVQDYRCINRYGFGYDRTIDDYKLVKTTVTGRNGINPETWVKVYTLGTNSWKTIRSSYKFILCSTKEDGNINGLFISGHLYYTAKKIWSNIIVSFDIAKEEYRQIPIPDIRINGVMNLGELKGCLCLLSSSTVLFGPWDVWMMRHNVENNMDVKEEYTWEKLYTNINPSVQRRWSYALNTKLLRICKNGEILMVEEHSYKKKIVLYDPKSGEITVLHEVDRERSVENYIESLLSLNSGTYLK